MDTLDVFLEAPPNRRAETFHEMEVISPRGYFRGNRTYNPGETVTVPEAEARKGHAAGTLKAIDPSSFDPELAEPVRPAALLPDRPNLAEWALDRPFEAEVISKGYYHRSGQSASLGDRIFLDGAEVRAGHEARVLRAIEPDRFDPPLAILDDPDEGSTERTDGPFVLIEILRAFSTSKNPFRIKGSKVNAREGIACRLIRQGVAKLAKGAALTTRGGNYLARLQEHPEGASIAY